MSAFRNEVTWEDLGDWTVADNLQNTVRTISIQDLRERMERVFGWLQNSEILMRTPHSLLGGETPWDVLYHTSGGARRIENILDLVDQGRLVEFPTQKHFKTACRHAI